ncbi:MAG: hypothetical protein MUO53_13065 [Maribacter sp.]|nr:hypothetical protein [Maribacter sp.]
MVIANSSGEDSPLFLADLQARNGKIAQRLVDINSEFAQVCFKSIICLEKEDYIWKKKTIMPL